MSSGSLDENNLEARLSQLEEAFDDLDRQATQMIALGTVVAVDPAGARVRVEIAGAETNWLPWTTARAHGVSFWSMPAVGEQIAVLSPGGDCVDGIVIPAIFQNQHPAPSTDPDLHVVRFDPETTLSFDTRLKRLAVTCSGSIDIEAKSLIRVVGATVQFTGGGIAVASAGTADISGEQIRLNDGG